MTDSGCNKLWSVAASDGSKLAVAAASSIQILMGSIDNIMNRIE